MNLEALFDGLEYEVVSGTPDKDVTSIVYHSDKVSAGSAFFAIKGAEDDGRKYIKQALEKGASVIVTDDREGARQAPGGACAAALAVVPDVRRALAAASANFFGRPAGGLLLIGVTGTKGKTTTAFMIKEIFEKAGIKTGIIGTVVNGCEGNFEEAVSTTPQSADIQRMLRNMADLGCRAVVMEVSSQGLMQQRIHGLEFDAAVFTNISPDHIGGNEHKDFEEYLYWKTMLFKQSKVAIINRDDIYWQIFSETAEKQGRKVITFSAEDAEPVLVRNGHILGTEFTAEGRRMKVSLPGEFNVYNALGAISVSRYFGVSTETCIEALAQIKVRGRAENVPFSEDFTVLVDYAHNGIALENLLRTLKEYRPFRLIAVFGCGGNRDPKRRSEMAQAASRFADFSVITSDNPRHEDPLAIIGDITASMDSCGGSYTVIPDRREAIEWAVKQGQPEDIIVIAGKGHETYQITGDVKTHFDDREIIQCVNLQLEKY